MFAAIRRASSLVSSLAADLRPGSPIIDIREFLAGAVDHDESGVYIFYGPRRREAASGQWISPFVT
jgi:hypothetical protein